MKIGDLIGYSFGAMKERKLRAALTIAMVLIGAGLITALNGMTTGIYQYIGGQFGTLGANIVMVMPGMQSTTKITEQTASVIRQIEGVKIAVPYVQQMATVQSAGTTASALVTGSDQRYLKEVFPNLEVAEGELIGPQDSIGIVLGHKVAHPPDKPTPFARVGSVVSVSFTVMTEKQPHTVKRNLIVKGILAEMGTSMMFPVDRMVFISLLAANSLFETSGQYSGINVITNSPSEAEQVSSAIRRVYGTSFEVYTSKTLIQLIQNILGALSLFLGSVASVSLIVASVGIFAGLYTSVMERTREIGLLKALGFKKRGILGVFLSEAALIGIIGGLVGDLLGVALGYGMAFAVTQFRSQFTGEMMGPEAAIGYVPPQFTLDNFLFVFAFSVAVSLLAGAYPAWRASRLDPVVALRKE